MGFLRFVIWTGLCVAFGIFAATVDFGGRTLWQHSQSAWKQNEPKLNKVKADASALADDVKTQVTQRAAATAPATGPKEKHSPEERAAIDQLIAKHAQPEAGPGARRP